MKAERLKGERIALSAKIGAGPVSIARPVRNSRCLDEVAKRQGRDLNGAREVRAFRVDV